jgi:hypothetical protein
MANLGIAAAVVMRFRKRYSGGTGTSCRSPRSTPLIVAPNSASLNCRRNLIARRAHQIEQRTRSSP